MNKEQIEHLKKLNQLGNSYFEICDTIHSLNIEIAKLEGKVTLLKTKRDNINKKVMSLSRLEVI